MKSLVFHVMRKLVVISASHKVHLMQKWGRLLVEMCLRDILLGKGLKERFLRRPRRS